MDKKVEIFTFFIVRLEMIPVVSPRSGKPCFDQCLRRFAKSSSSTTPAQAIRESKTRIWKKSKKETISLFSKILEE